MDAIYHMLRRLTRILYKWEGTGLPRVAEWIRKAVARHGPEHHILIGDHWGGRFFCNLREHMGGIIFFRGSYSRGHLDLLVRMLPVNGVFLDVGANQGEFSVAAALKAGEGKVLAFEPVYDFRVKLEMNLKINGLRNVSILPFALGDRIGTLPIYDQPGQFYDGSRHEGLTTLFKSPKRCFVRGDVDVFPLDQVAEVNELSRIDVIKMDIEGGELAALIGAKMVLARFRPYLILELCGETCEAAGYKSTDVIEWLEIHGYHVFGIRLDSSVYPLDINAIDLFRNVLAVPVEKLRDIEKG